MSPENLLHIAIGTTLLFAFVNGLHDGGNVVASIICSRSINPARALVLASVAEFAGALILGTAVATTIFADVLNLNLLESMNPVSVYLLIISGVGGAIVWKVPTWFAGLPSSGSHALIGGLVGAGLVAMGRDGVAVEKVVRAVVAPLLFSPLVGALLGLLVFSLIRAFFGRAHRSIGHLFEIVQEPTMVFLAVSHGSNDAQKSMGVIALILAAGAGEVRETASVPQWAMIACAAALAVGLSAGWWRIAKTVGYGICRMEPVHSFSSQLTAASVVLIASILGGPVSTTQVVSSSIMGVGTARRLSAVRWSAVAAIAYAWLLVLPASAALGAGLYWCFTRVISA